MATTKFNRKTFAFELGRLLRSKRRALDFTQEHVADRLGCQLNSISRYEKGYVVPRLDILCLLAEIYQTDVRDLIPSTTSNTK
jgi:transcriptional regulator with XRE-family HTH domain